MKLEEFLEETETLETFFEKPLNSEQSKMWYEEFKSYPVEKYRRMVLKAKQTQKFMPKLADMIEIAEKDVDATPTQEEHFEEVKCKKCRNSGLILYYDDKKAPHYALCDCDNIKNIPEGIRHRIYTAKELGI